ncbi:ABC transporter permease [Moorella sp. Hama-1]|uniref:ABC transporter permease n=1 Tax=Moorella sp. Hama-1 TaxID=2138101 RepID=UPI000D647372|nr:ABC transporter permease [Moorella sp. Hama-1]MDN5361976.1 ribose transport system permease protein [Moorella sp. (in: firmicutes)]BCV20592.1 sugar ABC transporter permease [Moorella sp. Hama-1]
MRSNIASDTLANGRVKAAGFSSLLKEYSFVLVFIVLCILVSIMVPNFLLPQNLLNVLIQVSINALLAIGMTFVIISAGIDLSVGSVAALAGIVSTALVKLYPNNVAMMYVLIVFSILAVGVLCGGISGFVISKLNIEPFIVTLAMMSIARGFAFVYTQSRPIFGLPSAFSWIGQGYIGPIPVIVVIMLICLLLAHIILSKTCFGRYVYAIGSNEEVARLCGINVARVKFMIYVISGVLSALGGVALASRLASGQPAAASGYELNAIAAVVLGGTSLSGGKGSIGKTIIGIMTIGVINNGLSLMRISSYWQSITMGLIIMVAVIIDKLNTRKKV